ncbi:hypothetical protein NIIDNTM18_53040 [Mycolicibacterium litorale]|uniref:Uncharacterized protein n=1 Tax=Mycolicibacterium litorale TaxID=758802 RepID=A0A6S6PDH4_9MYCO|nr:hypothetical protein [Mycolicibacterium litorale]BCI56026.1 hypothetical protein NIIDNTM18_53040 [Mycolicibacterium litorale]
MSSNDSSGAVGVRPVDRDRARRLCGITGARSVAALMAWKGGLSLDQVGVIADKAAPGSDEHYAELAANASVNQLRTAITSNPNHNPNPHPTLLLCPYHHRIITITGPAHHLTVTDSTGRELQAGSLARPPNGPPPAVPLYRGPSGERADWWWYSPLQPTPPTPTRCQGLGRCGGSLHAGE